MVIPKLELRLGSDGIGHMINLNQKMSGVEGLILRIVKILCVLFKTLNRILKDSEDRAH